MKYAVLIGRALYSAIFILSGPHHFASSTIAMGASQGVPLASVAVPASGVIALLGGMSVLLGWKGRCGAWLLVLFLVPVTLTMHRFWGLTDPQAVMIQRIMFLKNASMLGAALMITQLGTGPLSLRE